MNIRLMVEEREKRFLHERAKLSSQSAGRLKPEPECDIRPVFQRDRDRIIHSKAFRRLKHKTQVFLAPKGDHYRTRLTHTLEVSQIARTVARALRLNEDLVEAIALGHDLGHTPFGHAGEAVLNEIYPGGFKHACQSLRVVDYIENGGAGLNLTLEVRDGILKHSKGKNPVIIEDPDLLPSTLEGQVVRLSDLVAYVNADVDDAVRAGIITEEELPRECVKVLGRSVRGRIDTMIRDMLYATLKEDLRLILLSPEVAEAMEDLRGFLFKRVYEAEPMVRDLRRASKILKDLYHHFVQNPEAFTKETEWELRELDISRSVCDFIAGMTDQFAINLYDRLFLPRPWGVF